MTLQARHALKDILNDPDVAQPIKDYINTERVKYTPTDPTVLALWTTIKDTTKTVAERQAAVDQLIVLARQPDPVA